MGSEFHFRKGMEVEVFSDDKDLRGALFVATVVRSVSRRNKVLIEYQTLVADEEETKPLREYVDVVYLRPIPPREADRKFNTSDEVDAYHNDGWWEGVVIRVLEKGKYLVYFRPSKEELEFEQSEMRIHREWVRGVWVPPMVGDVKLEVDVSHVQRKNMEQDTATQHNDADVRNDRTQSLYVGKTADIVNGPNTRNHQVELPSCKMKISLSCKKLKKEVSERSLVREAVPTFGKGKTGGLLGYDRSAVHPMLDDFSLSPVYYTEEHCESSKSQVQYSQNCLVAQSFKKLKKGDGAGASVMMIHPAKEMATGGIPSPSDGKEKISSALHYYGISTGHPMLDGFDLSPLYNIEEHRELSSSRLQFSQKSVVAQSCKKSKKGEISRNAIRTESHFDRDVSERDPTIDDFGVSALLGIAEEQSNSYAQVHCFQKLTSHHHTRPYS